jgi:hypothetical protein
MIWPYWADLPDEDGTRWLGHNPIPAHSVFNHTEGRPRCDSRVLLRTGNEQTPR